MGWTSQPQRWYGDVPSAISVAELLQGVKDKQETDGTVCIIEFISATDKTLRTKTMWKEQSLGGGGSANKSNSSHTSKTGTNAIVPSTGKSISQTKRIGQELINLIQGAGLEVVTDKAEVERVLGELRKANKAEWEKNNDGKLYDFMKMPLVLQFINAPKTTKKRALLGYRPLGAHSLWDLYT